MRNQDVALLKYLVKPLAITQKTYDLIQWYVPILNRLPRDQKYLLGNRMIAGMYDVLEGLLAAQFAQEKLALLTPLNLRLDVLRMQTKMLLDFALIDAKRYEYASQRLNEIGYALGSWIKQQRSVR